MSATDFPQRIGSLWQQRVRDMREYEVIRDGNVFGTSFSPSFVYSSEYDDARNYLGELLREYRGRSFSSVFTGRDETNAAGICFVKESTHSLIHAPVDANRFRQDTLTDLTLVYGIGSATQKKLKSRGYATVTDLCNHPRYRDDARDVVSCLSAGNTLEIMELIGNRHSKSHRSVLGTTGLHNGEDFVFFDIETLGLFSRPIILFGIGKLKNERLEVYQYLLRDIEEEEAALLATVEHLSGDHPALVTFNGK
ncbi:MAG: exonuclease, partial [Methanomicrobiales archaeon]|nr:exonuclease [Methanomicrobiales archaeon]